MSENTEYDSLKKVIERANWQQEAFQCKYHLPCGLCDKTGRFCQYMGGRK